MSEVAKRKYSNKQNLAFLRELEKKILWLSAWTIHNANNIRASSDGLKVGGHQASCASVTTLMTALYFDVLEPQDRVAVKPHASPVFHAIQYLLGNQSKKKLQQFRYLNGAQSYPSRTKDTDDVDISTGSVGLGVGLTLFASMVRDYARLHKLASKPAASGRMIAIMGDAELDEGNVFEALLEGWKHDVRNLWWLIDYNRQSLDRVVSDKLFQKIRGFFDAVGWQVVILKYGKLQEAAFAEPGGEELQRWIDDCPNELYCALTFKGGRAWRKRLMGDIGSFSNVKKLLEKYDDDALQELMTNLAGHDMESVRDALHNVQSDVPHCFIIYTIKGFGLPFAGHKDNHAGLMNNDQMETFREAMGILPGEEWEFFSGLNANKNDLKQFLKTVPFNQQHDSRSLRSTKINLPSSLHFRASELMSTQEALGRILNDLGKGRSELAQHLVTSSPDVTVSTNLGGWVNQRGIFNRADREDIFHSEKVVSMQKWAMSRKGQHIELGIAENNLFLLLAAFGLAGPLFGTRLIPIGTVYDPFIARGLDALNYACYQDARFILVGTPSGISLAPEGGAHQSISAPLIGIGQPGLSFYEPAYADELAEILLWSFKHIQAENGGSVYLRLSTREIKQINRNISDTFRSDILKGAYWQHPPDSESPIAIAYSGVVASEATAAYSELLEDIPGVSLLAVTSPDLLHTDWQEAHRRRMSGDTDATAHIEFLLDQLKPGAILISIVDGHPATLSWLASVKNHRLYPLGTTSFGESGNIKDLYRKHRIDKEAILDIAALAFLENVN